MKITKPMKNAVLVICVAGSLSVIAPISAQIANSSHSHPGTNRFTRMGEEWPPQPKQMENVVWLRTSARRATRALALPRRGTTELMREPRVKNRLGDRFTLVGSTTQSGGKTSGNTKAETIYFSHSKNKTVQVMLDQGEVEDVRSIDPSEYQPPLTKEEVKEAIDIARSSLIQQGNNRVSQLKGYGILAFKTESELSGSHDKGFFENRIAYVSFHEDIDARPEFVAWVDLTQQTVVNSREDRL
ncbi:MAG: hypothetical protein V3V31_04355 [Methylococcales bacterium]